MKACKEVGSRLGVPVVDIWTSFLRHAGWTEGSVILGGPDMEINEEFNNLFSDGWYLKTPNLMFVSFFTYGWLIVCHRSPFDSFWLQIGV